MKAFLSLLLASLVSGVALRAQPEDMSTEQIESLVAPIALYPDPLVAIILPAATAQDDIALAAKFDVEDRFLGGIDAQPWDPAVKALARYPSVLKWMNDSPEWTDDLGTAFVQQRSAVMRAIQRLRWKAYDAGTLVSSTSMTVVIEGTEIRLVPPTDEVVYVPTYDVQVVYERRPVYTGPCITFGIGYPCGMWLNYYCDWSYCSVWRGPWVRGWNHCYEWRRPGHARDRWHHWTPDYNRHRTFDYRDREARRDRHDGGRREPRVSVENEHYSRATYNQVERMNREHNPANVGRKPDHRDEPRRDMNRGDRTDGKRDEGRKDPPRNREPNRDAPQVTTPVNNPTQTTTTGPRIPVNRIDPADRLRANRGENTGSRQTPNLTPAQNSQPKTQPPAVQPNRSERSPNPAPQPNRSDRNQTPAPQTSREKNQDNQRR